MPKQGRLKSSNQPWTTAGSGRFFHKKECFAARADKINATQPSTRFALNLHFGVSHSL